jgi:hypothetical protein
MNSPKPEVPAITEALAKRVGELEQVNKELVEALKPFALFAEKYDAKPLRQLDDRIYGIHAGTEWEAELSVSDCRKARAALAKAKHG